MPSPRREVAGTPPPAARRRDRVVAAVAAVVACALAWHVLMTFLAVAPSNPASRELSGAVDAWTRPLLRQNWRLFAPAPVSTDVALRARAQVVRDGEVVTTGWYDVTPDRSGQLVQARTDRQTGTAVRAWERAADRVMEDAGIDPQPTGDVDGLVALAPTGAVARRYVEHRQVLARVVAARLDLDEPVVAVQVEVDRTAVPDYDERDGPPAAPVTRRPSWWPLEEGT